MQKSENLFGWVSILWCSSNIVVGYLQSKTLTVGYFQPENIEHRLMNRLRNNHNPSQDIKSERNLRGSFTILITDIGEYGMSENAVTALCKRSPCLKNNSEFLCCFYCIFLMEERVTFYLINHSIVILPFISYVNLYRCSKLIGFFGLSFTKHLA